jgi:hypothetical protein
VHAIELALTEACTNVLDHAAETDEYEVSAGIDGTVCVIEVIDRGEGFDGSVQGHAEAEPSAEDGRGIQLMRALVDKVTFTSRPQVGHGRAPREAARVARRRARSRSSPRAARDRARPVVDDERFEDRPEPV